MNASKDCLHAARGDGQCARIEARAERREGIADHRVRRSAFDFVRRPRRMGRVRCDDVTRDLFEEARLPHAAFTEMKASDPEPSRAACNMSRSIANSASLPTKGSGPRRALPGA